MDILIVGEADSANLGDRAIHVTLRRLFESRGHRVRGWDLSRGRYARLDAEAAADGDAGQPRRRLRTRLFALLDRAPDAVQRAAVYVGRRRRFLLRRRAWADEVRRHDLVVFGGGALLMDNNWSFPLGLALFARAVRDAGRPYVCVGCSTGASFSRPGARWLKEFLDGCSFVALRDERSLEGLARIGDFDASVFVDSALTLGRICPQSPARGAGRLGVNVISQVRAARLGRQVHERYMDELASFVRQLGDGRASGIGEVVLFSTGEERDQQAARQFLARPELAGARIPLSVAPKAANLEALAATIAGFDLVISTRMHAGIIAKSYRVPLIAVGWDRKIRGFCEMIGIEADCFDIEECRAADLLGAVLRLSQAGFEQPDRVDERLAELAGLPDRIAQLIEGNEES